MEVLSRYKNICLAILICCTTTTTIYSRSLKLITITAADSRIAVIEGFKKSTKKLELRFELIANHLQVPFISIKINEPQFRKDIVLNRLADIDVSSDDIVILSVMSHGFRTDEINSDFPAVVLYNDDCYADCLSENSMPIELLAQNFYQSKKPQILLTIADSCNDSNSEIKIKEEKLEGKLFKEDFDLLFKSNITRSRIFDEPYFAIISSTSKGEQAAMTNKGGVYTNFFSDRIFAITTQSQQESVHTMLNKLTDLIDFKNSKPPKFTNEKQSPFYKLFKIEEPIIEQQETVAQETIPFTITPAYYVSNAVNFIRNGNNSNARKVLLNGLKDFPNNDDLKIGVFICEANLGFTKFTTMGNQGVCEIFNRMSDKEKKILELPAFVYLQYALGVNFLKGKGGCKKNPKEAARWLARSFNNGNKEGACAVLNRMGVYGCFKE